MANPQKNDASGAARLDSLDQFRGYTVLGMFLVNFVGYFQATPAILRHHNTYCSYADTIMPQFFLAVGFAYRMTFLRRVATAGIVVAWLKVLRRSAGLILIGAVIYHLDVSVTKWSELQSLGVAGFLRTAFQRNLFQALVHIGVTSIWVLPVMSARTAVLVLFASGSAVLQVWLSHAFYYKWVMTRPGIDGGPLGFLTWTIPLLVGAVAYDWLMVVDRRSWIRRVTLAACLLMAAGYVISCLNLVTEPAGLAIGPAVGETERTGIGRWLIEPPFLPPSHPVNVWTMSQRAGSVSYLTFGAGFSLAVLAWFVWACDMRAMRLGIFQTLGSNALAGYIIHELVMDAMRPFTPKDSPLWYVGLTFCVFLGVTYLFLKYLESNRLYLRL